MKENTSLKKSSRLNNLWACYHKATRSSDKQKLKKLLKTVYFNLEMNSKNLGFQLLANAIERDMVLTRWEFI